MSGFSPRLGLRGQVLTTLALLVSAMVLLVGVVVLGVSRQNLEAQARQNALRLAALATNTLSAALDDASPIDEGRNAENLQRLCEIYAEGWSARSVRVVGIEGGVLAAVPASAVDEDWPVEAAVVARSGEAVLRIVRGDGDTPEAVVFAPVVHRDDVAAVLDFRFPLLDLARIEEAGRTLTLLYLAIEAVLLLLFGYLLLTRWIVRPIAEIARATERVARGALQERVHPRGANELGELARSFNTMVDRIEQGRDRLESRMRELAEANAALEAAQREVVRAERLATIGTLSAGIAHEVGNPLAAVVGYLDLLADRDGLDDATVDDLVRRTQTQIDRIHRTIRALLDFARVGPERIEPVDLAEVAREAIELARHHRKGRGVVFHVGAEPSAPSARADRALLTQVLLNLLLNAADATSGGGDVEIAITRDREGRVALEVRDRGTGFTEEALRRATEPFYTTKPAGEGTGLGLAIVERVVTAFGGGLALGNREGGGAVVRVTLPEASGGEDAFDTQGAPDAPDHPGVPEPTEPVDPRAERAVRSPRGSTP